MRWDYFIATLEDTTYHCYCTNKGLFVSNLIDGPHTHLSTFNPLIYPVEVWYSHNGNVFAFSLNRYPCTRCPMPMPNTLKKIHKEPSKMSAFPFP